MTEFIRKCSGGSALRNTYVSSVFLSATICPCTQVLAQAQTPGPFSTKPVKIEGHGRALEDVLSQVQVAFKFPIYYEELPLENRSDLKAVAVPGIKTGLCQSGFRAYCHSYRNRFDALSGDRVSPQRLYSGRLPQRLQSGST